MQRSHKLIVVLLLIFQGDVLGQQNLKKFPQIEASTITGTNSFMPGIIKLPAKKYFKKDDDNPIQSKNLLKALPADWYSTHLGFFCKKELQLEKMIAVPFRFRIGSLDYVNYLEQKPNTTRPQ